MNQLEDLHKIAKYLSRFSEQIRILNSAQDFSLNITAENLLVHLLNKAFDLRLVNVNNSRKNYPAIDLLDEQSRIAVQVTANVNLSKIYDGVEKYFKHALYEKADRLLFFSLTPRTKISQSAIDARIAKASQAFHGHSNRFSIQADRDILDNTSVYHHLEQSTDGQKINDVAQFLQQQFDAINTQENLTIYHEKLRKLFLEVVMDDEKGMTLDQVYITPAFLVHCNAFKHRLEDYEHNKFLAVDKRYKITEFIDDFLAGTNPLKCLATPNLLLLLGYPGQGKTSLMKKFLHEYISNGSHLSKRCFFFSLQNITDVRSFIANPLKVLHEEVSSQLGFTLDYFAFSRSIILLDGLDELYMKDSLHMDEVEQVVAQLINLTAKLEQLQIILTSRYGYIDDKKLASDRILIVQLSFFDLKDQYDWLTKYRRFHPETWLTEDKLTAIDDTNELIYIKELIQQPLLLFMMASLAREVDKEVSRSNIYDQMFTELIERKYSKRGQIDLLKSINKEDLRRLIREIAFVIFKSGSEHISKSDLLKVPETKKFLARIPNSSLHESIKGIMIAFYFREMEKDTATQSREQGNYAIEFLHKSLREYMTAEKVVFTLINAFLSKNNDTGIYLIDNFDTAISVLQSLFKRRIPAEVNEHLKGILYVQPPALKKELEERLMSFFPALLRSFFLKDYNYKDGLSPSGITASMFGGFWRVVSWLGLSKNYFTRDMQFHFTYLLKLLSMEEGTVYNLNFDHQDLSDFKLDGVFFENCLFIKTTFKKTFFNNVQFYGCGFEDVLFEGNELLHVEFTKCSVFHCNFVEANIGLNHFSGCRFDDCSFNGVISTAELLFNDNGDPGFSKIENCDFNSSILSPSTLKWIDEHAINCTVKSTLFRNWESALSDPETLENLTKLLLDPREEDVPPANYKRLLPNT